MLKLKRWRFSLAVLALIPVCCSLAGAAKKKAPPVPDRDWKSDPQFDLVVDKITARESLFVKTLGKYTPMVETYIQNMRPDKELGQVPISDEYFLGRIKLGQGVEDVNFVPLQTRAPKHNGKKQVTGSFISSGFSQMIIMDMSTFDRQHYDFRFVKREFLGEVRTLVIDVKPREPHSKSMFIGRMWAEDQQYNVVRFNGTYTPQPKKGVYVHFDSWRENMANDQWLPAYIFSEETNLVRGNEHWDFRAQTLLWGYNALRPNKGSEFTEIVVDTPDEVKDQSDSKQDLTTVAGQRAWQRQAEDNVLDRMQRAGLLAPEGDVDKVLNTVVQNIEVTNNIEEPEIRCRVLLTQPMESFTVGNTIVVSRGLLDALPDEASLAAILAHEMGHILDSHQINEKYAFSDRMIFPDRTTISKIQVSRTPEEEKAADEKALQLLQNSPYKDKLASAGLFLSAMHREAPQLPHLLKGHFGNPLVGPGTGVRMSTLANSAPALQVEDVKQIAALPLGGRIKLNAWSDQLTIQKTHAVRLTSAKEKMPFQVTPMFPYLTREAQVGATTPSTGKSVPEVKPPAPSAEPKPTPPPNSQPQ
jgi:Zn-dependent protease with chaperone function